MAEDFEEELEEQMENDEEAEESAEEEQDENGERNEDTNELDALEYDSPFGSKRRNQVQHEESEAEQEVDEFVEDD